jgi:hypothetical protein
MTIRNRFRGVTPVGRWLGSSGGIRSIQAGSIAINAAASNTATIASVIVGNSVIIYGGHTTNDVGTTRPVTTARVTLTNSTTVTATNGLNSGIQTVTFTVIEFEPGVLRSVQRGTITVGASATETATITAVDTRKAAVIFLGFTIAAFASNDLVYPRLDLTNSTTVTATVALAGGSTVVGYQVVEFN